MRPAWGNALAGWRAALDLDGAYGAYSGSKYRKTHWRGGTIANVYYQDEVSAVLGYHKSRVALHSPAPDARQSEYFGRLRAETRVDGVPGLLIVQVDGHLLRDDDPSGATDAVSTLEPRFSFRSYGGWIAGDVGMAQSRYGNGLRVRQWTPSLASSLGDPSLWLSARAYAIRFSNPAQAGGSSETLALEIKAAKFLARPRLLGVDRFYGGILVGDRLFAVDSDAMAVYNLADRQRASGSAGVGWRWNKGSTIDLLGGFQRYENAPIGEAYTLRFLYLGIRKEF